MYLLTWLICFLIVVGFFFISYLTGLYVVVDDENIFQLIVRPSVVLFIVDEEFLSVTLDISYALCLLSQFSEKEWSRLEKLSSLLSPAYLRFGGSDADRVIFKFDGAKNHSARDFSCTNNEHDKLIITGPGWLKLNEFARKAKLKFIVDLNVLLRNGDNWDSSNTTALISFSEKNSIPLDFQLGNEPSNYYHHFGVTISATQLAEDYHELKTLLKSTKMYGSSKVIGPEVRPKLLDASSLSFLDEFLSGDSLVDVVSWHQYYLNGQTAVLNDFTDPKTLDIFPVEIEAVTEVVENFSEDIPIWITETSSAFNGGAPGLSDRFAATFLWLDKLGVAAKNGISVVMRQTLFRSSYALIDDNLDPTPDFWISLFYKNVVGRKVLKIIAFAEDIRGNHFRFYCHCLRPNSTLKGNIVIFGMNLRNTEDLLFVSGLSIEFPVKAFIFSPEAGDLKAKSVLLNSKVLRYNQTTFYDLAQLGENITFPLILGPYSIAFWVFQDREKNACDD